MTTTLYPGTPIPTTRSWPRRRWADLALAWMAWRERRRQLQALRVLDELSAGTLKDIGLGEFASERQRSLAAADFLRGL